MLLAQVANADFFLKMVPLFDAGDDVGMVLSPQAFHNIDVRCDVFNHSNVQFWEYAQVGYDALPFISCTGGLCDAVGKQVAVLCPGEAKPPSAWSRAADDGLCSACLAVRGKAFMPGFLPFHTLTLYISQLLISQTLPAIVQCSACLYSLMSPPSTVSSVVVGQARLALTMHVSTLQQ